MGRKSKIEEEELLKLLSTRDKRGVELLYDNFSSVFYGVILRIVRNDEIAEALLQEALLQIVDNSSRFDPSKSRLFTWMVNICRNLAIQKIRSEEFIGQNKNQSQSVSVSVVEGKSSYDPDLTDTREIIKKLEPEYRQIIDQLFFEGLSQPEAAGKLNIPLGTVKTRSRAAMQRLRDHFDSDR